MTKSVSVFVIIDVICNGVVVHIVAAVYSLSFLFFYYWWDFQMSRYDEYTCLFYLAARYYSTAHSKWNEFYRFLSISLMKVWSLLMSPHTIFIYTHFFLSMVKVVIPKNRKRLMCIKRTCISVEESENIHKYEVNLSNP